MTSVRIGKGVKYIDNYAFYLAKINEVFSMVENPEAIGEISFSDDTFYNATLYVPEGTIDKYKSTEGWKKFVFIEEGFPSCISDIENEGSKVLKRYTLDGRTTMDSRKGMNVIQMTNGETKKVIVK